MRKSILSLLCCLTFAAKSQTTFKINIGVLIKEGQITATYSTLDIGSINDIFDGSTETLARTASINPAVITLEFERTQRLGASRLYTTYSDGKWQVETAMSVEDLNSKTGSYQNTIAKNKIKNAKWDSIGFTPVNVRVVRLTLNRTTGDDYVHINEWELYTQPTITSLCITPGDPKLLVATSLQFQLIGKDTFANEFIIPNNFATWESSQPTIATVTSTGSITGIKKGNSDLTIQYLSLGYTVPVNVKPKITSAKAKKQIVKTAIFIEDPPVPSMGNQRFHTLFGWNDPLTLAHQIEDSMEKASNNVVDYQFKYIYNDTNLFTRMEGTLLSVDSMAALLSEPGWITLNTLGTQFDYNLFLDFYNLCEKSDSGLIDDIWIFSFPGGGMWESELAGKNSFWYNSPPLNYGNTCVGLLPMMGFNYERGYGEAMHSYGHRVESTMSQLYGGWVYDGTPANNWELFTSIDLYTPGQSHVGNIHYPPNGVHDYDYLNTTQVINYAQNWLTFPYLFNKSKTITCTEWHSDEGQYMMWWYSHLPHFTGKGMDDVLNNWWPYIIDYEEGLRQAGTTSFCQCKACSTVNFSARESTTGSSVSEGNIANSTVDEVRVYPTITSGDVIIDIRSNCGTGKIVITNISGIVLKEFVFNCNQSSTQHLDLRQFAPSTCIIQVTTNDVSKCFKVGVVSRDTN